MMHSVLCVIALGAMSAPAAEQKPVFLYSRYFNAVGENRYLPDGNYKELLDRLKGKVDLDNDTARRLFTLICALHWKG